MLFIKQNHILRVIFSVVIISVLAACGNTNTKNADVTQNIIQKAIDKHNTNIIDNQYAIEGYYYGCGSIGNDCVSFAEGIGLLVSHGNESLIPTSSLTFLPINMRKSKPNINWLDYMKNFYDKMGGELIEQSDFPPEYISLLNAFRRFEIVGPLSNKMNQYYNFSLLNQEDNCISVSFSAKNEIPYYSYEGILYINNSSLQIDSINVFKTQYYSNQHAEFIDGYINIKYSHSNNINWPSKIAGGYLKDELKLSVSFQTLNEITKTVEIRQDDYQLMHSFSENPNVLFYVEEWDKYELLYNITSKRINCNCELSKNIKPLHNQPFYTALYIDGEESPEWTEDEASYIINKIAELKAN